MHGLQISTLRYLPAMLDCHVGCQVGLGFCRAFDCSFRALLIWGSRPFVGKHKLPSVHVKRCLVDLVKFGGNGFISLRFNVS